MGISANIAGWRCRNEHAEKSENIEKEKLANQSAIKQQGSLPKKLKKTVVIQVIGSWTGTVLHVWPKYVQWHGCVRK